MTLLAAVFLVVMFIPHLIRQKKRDSLVKGDPFLIIFILGLTFLTLTSTDIGNRLWVSSFLWAFVTCVLVKLYVWPMLKASNGNGRGGDKAPEERNLEFEIQGVVILLLIVFVITGIVI